MSPAKIAAAIAQARAIGARCSLPTSAFVALDDLAVIIGRELEAAGELPSFDSFISACGSEPVGGMRPAAPAPERSVIFDYQPFLNSHGFTPRNKEGWWAFEFEDSTEPWFASPSLRFSVARNEAMIEARRRALACGDSSETITVKVLP